MANWKNMKLLEIAEIVGGGTPSTSKNEFWGEDIPWITPKDLSGYSNRYISHGERNITEEGLKNSSAKILPKGAVLLTSRAPIGYVAIAKNNLCTNQGFKSLVLKESNSSEFFYYLLKLNKNYITNMASGSTFAEISGGQVKELEFNIPDYLTQQKIAKVLSAIDDKIELNNKINENLEQQIKALYNNSFKNLYEIVDISSLIDVRDGTHDSPKPKATGKKLITSKHLLKYGIDKTSANLISEIDYKKINERSQVITNDILISMIGTVGVVSLVIENPVDFCVKNVGIFRTSQAPELTYYIHCFLNSGKTQNYIHSHLAGTTQKYISLAELRTLKTPVPTKDELKNFNKLVEPIYNKLVNNTQENKNLTQLRDTLLPKLMSGEVDVKNINL